MTQYFILSTVLLQSFFDSSSLLFPVLAQSPTEDPSPPSHMMLSPQSLISLLLLGLTVTLSGSVYLWILRYVCLGCCQPVAVGPETEALAVMVWSPSVLIRALLIDTLPQSCSRPRCVYEGKLLPSSPWTGPITEELGPYREARQVAVCCTSGLMLFKVKYEDCNNKSNCDLL